ncbi:MAG: helix-turn-helix domain-containing protein [Candidatus Kapabacteria bacterium]|nr:helix-turn-helix domain-containing protein [Ignavibacteria bacterium]MBK6420210.1 helix-turn-helix domain-containing protein [Ignavibacteria bacterium]MBK7412842.1 helix-turn-helix domain-containing protein [Ignavibacteria bacterium]MBP6508920.1 helix-turn-helix domain-containing protein [Candidatus Kapabacteria bacterium]MBP7093105.1 helix-turn-helix domain-containing protein [Candidatus Kapabacteria bacterium]
MGDRQPATSHIEPNAPAPLPADPFPAQNQDAAQLPDLLSINETADYLRVTRTTVNRLIRSGALTGTHVGRRHLITRKSIENYLALSGND